MFKKIVWCLLIVTFSAKAEVVPRQSLTMPLSAKAVFMDLAVHNKKIIAVGERGIILNSTDGGETWKQTPSPVDVTLTSIDFTPSGEGWIVGHEATILHSSDSGESWQISKYKPEDERFYLAVNFISDQEGYVLGTDGELWKTIDSGVNWSLTLLAVEDWYQNHLFGMASIKNSSLVIAERGGIFSLKDGEAKWLVVPSPYEGSYFGVLTLNNNFLVYGMSGQVFLINAETLEWKKVDTRTDQFLLDATLSEDGQMAIIVGRGGVVLRVDGEGKVVDKVERKSRVDYTAVAIQGDQVFVASMAGGVENIPLSSFMNKAGK